MKTPKGRAHGPSDTNNSTGSIDQVVERCDLAVIARPDGDPS